MKHMNVDGKEITGDHKALLDCGITHDTTIDMVRNIQATTDSSQVLRIFVKFLTGKTFVCNSVHSTNLISYLQARIEMKVGIPAADQRLIYCGAILDSKRTFEDSKIPTETAIYCVPRSRQRDSGCIPDALSTLDKFLLQFPTPAPDDDVLRSLEQTAREQEADPYLTFVYKRDWNTPLYSTESFVAYTSEFLDYLWETTYRSAPYDRVDMRVRISDERFVLLLQPFTTIGTTLFMGVDCVKDLLQRLQEEFCLIPGSGDGCKIVPEMTTGP